VNGSWMRERQKEYYYRLAKEKGYRSRAAFKLLQISRKYGIIREGDSVVDLGAAPGGCYKQLGVLLVRAALS